MLQLVFQHELEEIGQEFKSTANSTEKNNILSKTLGGTKVHLLLGVKNTRIKPVIIRVLSPFWSRSVLESI